MLTNTQEEKNNKNIKNKIKHKKLWSEEKRQVGIEGRKRERLSWKKRRRGVRDTD